MQFTTKFKHIIFLNLILLISVCLNAQEIDSIPPVNTSDTTEIKEAKKKFKIFNFFKKKDKSEKKSEDENLIDEDLIDEDEEQVPDTAENGKPKKRFFNFLKKKNKKDSIVNDSLNTDSSDNKKRFRLFKKNVNDSTRSGKFGKKPQRISLFTWNKMCYSEQDSLLRVWDDFDKEHYKKKKRFLFTRKEVETAIKLKQNRNIYERLIYKRARNKPFKYRKKIIKRKNSRYIKTLLFDRLNKSETAPSDTVSDTRRYQIVNKRYKREAKKEAVRKNKVIIKYDRKEDRLKQRYELSGEEKKALNKGRGMQLKGTELILYNRGKRKQEKFTEKILKLRKKRSIELQNAEVRKRMKQKNMVLKKRDKAQFGNLFNKKKKSDKHDSYEYPKRYPK